MTDDFHSVSRGPAAPETRPVGPGDFEAENERLRAELAAVTRQRDLYATIARDLPTGLAILDRNMVFLQVNAVYAGYFDRPIDYIVGRHVFEFLPESQPFIEDLLTRVLKGEVIHKEEYCLVYTDERGTHESFWDFRYAPLLDERGQPEGIIALAQEVSARVRMKQELEERRQTLESQQQLLNAVLDKIKESEERYRAIFERAPVGILQTDLEGCIIGFNPAFEQMLGYREDELIGLPPGALTHPDEQEDVAAFLKALGARESGTQTLEKRCRRQDGRYIIGRIHVSLMRDAKGQPSSVLWLVQDVTERKQAEERLVSSQRQLKEAQAIAHIGSWEWDASAQAFTSSDELNRILGLEPQSIVSSLAVYLERVPFAERAAIEDLAAAVIPPGETRSLEHRIIRPSGEERTVRLLVQMPEAIDGLPPKRIGVVQDITNQRVLDRMKDEFITIVSHELRTPLTSIRAPLMLLASGKISSESAQGRQMLEIGARSVERMVRLVNDILDMHRLATGHLRIKQHPCDAADLVGQAVETMRPIAEQAGVELQAITESIPLQADATRIIQVLSNLLDNAVSFSPAGRVVRVSVERRDGQARFCVKDEGPGVPPGKQEMIFERFKQADASLSRRKEGTGLGLAICRAIVEQHGGRIWVGAEAGPGATFCFTVPIAAT